MEDFLIGAGLAFLLALLAWNDSIRNLHENTLDVEKDFSTTRNLNLRKIRTIIRGEKDASKRIAELNKLTKTTKLSNGEDIGIIEELINLDKDRHSIEKLYKTKYRLVIILTQLFIVSGIINYFIIDEKAFNFFCVHIKIEFIPILVCLIIIYIVLYFVIKIYNVENKYVDKLKSLMDRM